jgi:type IV pilus assembly protein PilB
MYAPPPAPGTPGDAVLQPSAFPPPNHGSMPPAAPMAPPQPPVPGMVPPAAALPGPTPPPAAAPPAAPQPVNLAAAPPPPPATGVPNLPPVPEQLAAPNPPSLAEIEAAPPKPPTPGSTPLPNQLPGPTLNFRGATAMQLQGKRLRIGEVLIEMGLIDQGQLDHALSIQKETGQRLGKVLISEGLATSIDIAKALARRLSIEYVELGEMEISHDVLALVPFETCTRYDVVPIGQQGTSLLVAMADPTNVFALDDLRLVTGRDIRVVVSSPESIDLVLSRMINLDDSVASAVDSADDWDEDLVPLEDIKDSNSEAPAIRLVNQIISQAVVTGASDLHFEPQAEDMVVRFRTDGVLQHVTTVPNKLRPGVTSRIKIMASLDISERRRPQDGRVGLLVGEKAIDLRVAVLPTVYGEKSVMRVLDKSNAMLPMEQLGFLPQQMERMRACYTQPYGCLLVTGPTGSGKSTTLYAALNEVNDVEKNIITVEDPVEYRLKGINQVQVNNKAGLTFAAALRSILRCDPDIVMIGEMRDLETANIGIEAALTGHLVLSTLHTNNAPGAVTRLTEMGVEPFLVTSSVLGVLAQRLMRRLCKCKEAFTPDRDYLHKMRFPQEIVEGGPIELYKAVGCHRCAGKGYKGRMGIHEVMLMSEEIEHLAMKHASAEEISRVALKQGMIDLFHDGVAKIMMGHTTMEELHRIVQH